MNTWSSPELPFESILRWIPPAAFSKRFSLPLELGASITPPPVSDMLPPRVALPASDMLPAKVAFCEVSIVKAAVLSVYKIKGSDAVSYTHLTLPTKA